MSIPGQLPPMFISSGENGLMPSDKEGDLASEAEQYFLDKGVLLPPDQRAQFLARIREMAGQIHDRINEMRQGGSSAEAIKRESEALFTQLTSTGDRFLAETERFFLKRTEQDHNFDLFDKRLKNMKLELSGFVAPAPSQSRDFGAMLELARKDRVEGSIAIARAGAFAVEGATTLVVEGAKLVVNGACNQNFLTKKACEVIGEQGKEMAKFAVRDFQVVGQEFCEQFPGACRAMGSWTSVTNDALPQALESQFGIPREIGEQYSKDAFTLGTTFLAFTPTLKLSGAFRGTVEAIKDVQGCVWETVFCKGKNVLNGFIDGRSVKQVSKAISKPSSELGYEGLIDFQGRMDKVAERLKDYSSGTKANAAAQFAESLPRLNPEPFVIEDSKKVLPLIAQGRSGSSVYFVKHDGLETLYVVKNFPALAAPNGNFAKEIVAYETLKGLKLKNLDFPRMLKVGKHKALEGNYEQGLLAMTPIRGKSLAVIFDEISVLERGSQLRNEALFSFQAPMEKAGKALAEIHRKSYQTVAPSTHFISQDMEVIRGLYDITKPELQKLNIRYTLTESQVAKRLQNFKQNSGGASFVHGDAHLPNFFWDEKMSKLAAIDTSTLTESFNARLQPIGAPVKDCAQWDAMLGRYGSREGFTSEEIASLRQSFHRGYKQEFIHHHSEEARQFYELYWGLRRLNNILKSKEISLEEAKEVVKQLNALGRK